jgi:hypothetical protein
MALQALNPLATQCLRHHGVYSTTWYRTQQGSIPHLAFTALSVYCASYQFLYQCTVAQKVRSGF